MANISKIKIPKPSKPAGAQTIEGFISYLKFRNEAVLKLIQWFLPGKFHTMYSTLKAR